jgi:hypothetical protein
VNPAGCNLDYVPFVFLTQSSQPLRHIKAKLAGSKIRPMNPVHPSVVASWREEREHTLCAPSWVTLQAESETVNQNLRRFPHDATQGPSPKTERSKQVQLEWPWVLCSWFLGRPALSPASRRAHISAMPD